MARETFTVARRHGASKFEVVVGPEQGPRFHRRFLKTLLLAKSDPTWAEAQQLVAVRRVRATKAEPRARRVRRKPEAKKPKKPGVFSAATSAIARRLRIGATK